MNTSWPWLLMLTLTPFVAAADTPRRTDVYGDALPEDVAQRLGTLRFRHGNFIKDVALSADGKFILAADNDSVRLWDARTGKELRRFAGNGPFKSAALSPDGKLVVATPIVGKFYVWETHTGKVVRRLEGEPFGFVSFSPNGKYLASIGLTSRAYLWDVGAGNVERGFDGRGRGLTCLAFAPDSRTLYLGDVEGTVRAWDVTTGKERGSFNLARPAGRLAVSPDGKTLAVIPLIPTKYDPKSRWWPTEPRVGLLDTVKLKGRVRLAELRWLEVKGEKDEGFDTLNFTPDSKELITTGIGMALRVWTVATGKERSRIPMSSAPALSASLSSDGKLLVTGGTDGIVRRYNLSTGKELASEGHAGRVTAVAISSDARSVATGSRGVVRVWDRSKGTEVRRFDCPGGLYGLRFSHDGKALLVLGRDVRGLDLATGKERYRLANVSAVSSALSPDGKALALGNTSETVRIADVDRGKLVGEFREPGGVWRLGFTGDGRGLFTCATDATAIHFRDLASGKQLRVFAPRSERQQPFDVAFSPDGRWVALGRSGHEITLYDLATEVEARQITKLPENSTVLAFSPDSRYLAWAGHSTVAIIEVATGHECLRLAGHQGEVLALAFSADGTTLVSGGQDTTALVWDLTGRSRAKPLTPLTVRAAARSWTDLQKADARQAYRAVQELAASPEVALPLLRKQLSPAMAIERDRVQRLLRALDDEKFTEREKAQKELDELGERVEGELRKTLEAEPSPEVRKRVERMLERIHYDRIQPSPERITTLRALTILERAAGREARRLLEELAQGAPGAWLTTEARAALRRRAN